MYPGNKRYTSEKQRLSRRQSALRETERRINQMRTAVWMRELRLVTGLRACTALEAHLTRSSTRKFCQYDREEAMPSDKLVRDIDCRYRGTASWFHFEFWKAIAPDVMLQQVEDILGRSAYHVILRALRGDKCALLQLNKGNWSDDELLDLAHNAFHEGLTALVAICRQAEILGNHRLLSRAGPIAMERLHIETEFGCLSAVKDRLIDYLAGRFGKVAPERVAQYDRALGLLDAVGFDPAGMRRIVLWRGFEMLGQLERDAEKLGVDAGAVRLRGQSTKLWEEYKFLAAGMTRGKEQAPLVARV